MIQQPLNCEEVARLGKKLYAEKIEASLAESQQGKIVAIDVTTEKYALADTPAEATARLGSDIDRTQVYLVRVGSPTFFRHGFIRGNRNP